MSRYLLLSLCALLLFGCEQKSEQPTPTAKAQTVQLQPFPEVSQKPVILLKDPLNAVLVETATEAIPIWREFAKAKPTLVLLSQNPFLATVPDRAKDETLQLIHNGELKDFKSQATSFTANPVFLPEMALKAALDAGFFSKIMWILPTAKEEAVLSLDIFRKQLIASGSATQNEAASFFSKDQGFSGTIHQTPVTAIPWHALGPVKGPLVIHLDLSFIKALYRNEIKKPIHPLTYEILTKLRELSLSTFNLTISHSHRAGDVPLDIRFVSRLIAQICSKPEMLDQPQSKQEQRHQKARYLVNFFKNEQVNKLYQAMDKATQRDAGIKYALYQSARNLKLGGEALDFLAQAIQLDPAYALEYINLASTALGKQRPDEALRMLKLAQNVYPDDPFIQIRQAKIWAMTGNAEQAQKTFATLIKLPWSTTYFKHIPGLLQQEMQAINWPTTEDQQATLKEGTDSKDR